MCAGKASDQPVHWRRVIRPAVLMMFQFWFFRFSLFSVSRNVDASSHNKQILRLIIIFTGRRTLKISFSHDAVILFTYECSCIFPLLFPLFLTFSGRRLYMTEILLTGPLNLNSINQSCIYGPF